jgi:hypothetical protein
LGRGELALGLLERQEIQACAPAKDFDVVNMAAIAAFNISG